MIISRQLLCVLYGAIALLALVATWHQNVAYFRAADPVTGTVRFWRETLVTPASVSITVDIFLFGLAVVVWMVAEARRLGIRFVWVYVLLPSSSAVRFGSSRMSCSSGGRTDAVTSSMSNPSAT